MNVPLALAAAAVALGWVWPRWMLRHQHGFDPRIAMVAWPCAQLLFVAGVISAAVTLIIPGHATTFLSSLLGQCWDSLAHATPAAGESLVGAVGATAVLAAAAGVAIQIVGRLHRQRCHRRRLSDTITLTGFRLPEYPDVWWLDDERPVAFCLPGRGARIAASTGLWSSLTARELTAVLAHERAHSQHRHHMIIAWAESVGATMALVPLFHRGARTVRGLSEQAADAAAASRYGGATVASALIKLANTPDRAEPPPHSLAAAHGSLACRLDRLNQRTPGSPITGGVGVAAATLLCVVGPALAVTAALGLLTCS